MSTPAAAPLPIGSLRAHDDQVHALHFVDDYLLSGLVFAAVFFRLLLPLSHCSDAAGVIIAWKVATRRPVVRHSIHQRGILSLKSSDALILT